ncbi:hypothetical protein SORBI_3001G033800 [Sorghum bicolor]|uniref:Uncharacterized protein n=1 Tax=Sorghum bicolor TaxID=4558 RepID=C5WV06_SORBI|nr:hypothetical protein SORBI_3001G033800 [Sorghum bicolor]
MYSKWVKPQNLPFSNNLRPKPKQAPDIKKKEETTPEATVASRGSSSAPERTEPPPALTCREDAPPPPPPPLRIPAWVNPRHRPDSRLLPRPTLHRVTRPLPPLPAFFEEIDDLGWDWSLYGVIGAAPGISGRLLASSSSRDHQSTTALNICVLLQTGGIFGCRLGR